MKDASCNQNQEALGVIGTKVYCQTATRKIADKHTRQYMDE